MAFSPPELWLTLFPPLPPELQAAILIENDWNEMTSPIPQALNVQVGGDHYKKLTIQPMEYSMKNGLDACQHTVIKYVTRFRDKGTPLQDLEKAKHAIDLLIQFEGLRSEK